MFSATAWMATRPRSGTSCQRRLIQREAKVLALLAHGLSNREIATRLVISAKTVEHHVSQILSKLGLRSRAEAAAYAASHTMSEGPANNRGAQ
jgi:DNA-binding NarL/FixJ family response regulator